MSLLGCPGLDSIEIQSLSLATLRGGYCRQLVRVGVRRGTVVVAHVVVVVTYIIVLSTPRHSGA